LKTPYDAFAGHEQKFAKRAGNRNKKLEIIGTVLVPEQGLGYVKQQQGTIKSSSQDGGSRHSQSQDSLEGSLGWFLSGLELEVANLTPVLHRL